MFDDHAARELATRQRTFKITLMAVSLFEVDPHSKVWRHMNPHYTLAIYHNLFWKWLNVENVWSFDTFLTFGSTYNFDCTLNTLNQFLVTQNTVNIVEIYRTPLCYARKGVNYHFSKCCNASYKIQKFVQHTKFANVTWLYSKIYFPQFTIIFCHQIILLNLKRSSQLCLWLIQIHKFN
jgi:hypothetical protein